MEVFECGNALKLIHKSIIPVKFVGRCGVIIKLRFAHSCNDILWIISYEECALEVENEYKYAITFSAYLFKSGETLLPQIDSREPELYSLCDIDKRKTNLLEWLQKQDFCCAELANFVRTRTVDELNCSIIKQYGV